MSSVYDIIKDKLDLTNVAARYTQLERAGMNGRVKGLCPLHTEKTPSFFVYGDGQRWHCFGCNQGGDIFDLVGAIEHWDTAETLRELARQANVELQPLTPEQKAKQEQQRAVETALGVAVAHWQQAIRSPNSTGMAYAYSRGWTDETVEYAGLGYHHDAERLRAALLRSNIELDTPTARALLITPSQSLIYPHFNHGRVVYYAARCIHNKRHWNPDAVLIGERRPYFNHHYHRNAPAVVIIEGQGDGVSLGQLDQAAVATAGTAITDELVKTLRERHKAIYIGQENNPAGREAARKIAAKFGGLARIVNWSASIEKPKPGFDANDWLQTGGDAIALENMLHTSKTWLEILTAEAVAAPPEDAQDATRRVFAALVHLDDFALTRVQANVCDALDMTKGTFTAMLKIARLEAGQDQHGRPLYEIIGGQMCQRQYDRYGGETINPLANFTARIVADIVEDDGQNTQRYFTLSGAMSDGMPLPMAEIKAEEFTKMNWIMPVWGAKATITAGNSTKEHLRAAIQTLSDEIESRCEYAHLGFRVVEDAEGKPTPRYLTANGAVGDDRLAVRLPDVLTPYRLPLEIDTATLPDAIRASLAFMDIGVAAITVPLWASMYLAPLASVLPPAFTVWLFGTTGSMKSTATALAMCHYGRFSYNLPAPASWVSDTTYALRFKAFTAKDAPLWVDDYAKQSTAAGERELRKKAETLLREWGNRSGRSAGQADGGLRTTHDPRGLVVSTAEQLPPNPSIHPRLFAVEIHPGDISHGKDSALTHAQQVEAKLYPLAMAGYIEWLVPQLDTLPKDLAARRDILTQKAAGEMQHLRSPMNVATLYIGWEMGIRYAHAHGIIDDDMLDEWLDFGWGVLVQLTQQQDAEINREEDPIRMYFEAIDHMLLQGTVYLRHQQDHANALLDRPTVDKRQPNAAFIGWYDDAYLYLLDQPTYNAVASFHRAGGRVFPDSARGIKVKLLEQGRLHPNQSDKYRYRLSIGNDQPWTLRVLRNEQGNNNE